MDSNSIAQLVAALKESLPAHVPAPINQNSVLIWQMIIAAATPVLAAFAVWLTKRSTEAKLDTIHTEVNSKNLVMAQKLETLTIKTEELVKTNATLVEKQRGIETSAAVAAAQVVARRSEPEITKGL